MPRRTTKKDDEQHEHDDAPDTTLAPEPLAPLDEPEDAPKPAPDKDFMVDARGFPMKAPKDDDEGKG